MSISSKFFIPIKGPEGHTDNTATYTFIIKTHSIEQFNQNELTLQDCGIIIIYIFYYNYYYTSSNMILCDKFCQQWLVSPVILNH